MGVKETFLFCGIVKSISELRHTFFINLRLRQTLNLQPPALLIKSFYGPWQLLRTPLLTFLPVLIVQVHIKPTDRHQYLHYSFSHPEHKKDLLYLPKLDMSVKFVLVETDFEIIPCK